SAERFLLPDAFADIRSREDRPVLAEVHNRALYVRTETVGVMLVAGQCGGRQHRLDRDRFNWFPRSSASAASSRTATRARLWAAAISHAPVSTVEPTPESSGR